MPKFFETLRSRAYWLQALEGTTLKTEVLPAPRRFLVKVAVTPKGDGTIPSGFHPGEVMVSVRDIHHATRPVSYQVSLQHDWRRRGWRFYRGKTVTRRLIPTVCEGWVLADKPEEITVRVTGGASRVSTIEWAVEELI